MLKALFGLLLWQTSGLVASLLKLAKLDWPVPDYTTLRRRQSDLTVTTPCRPNTGALHLLIDSTGIKAAGDRRLQHHAAAAQPHTQMDQTLRS